MSVYLVFVSYCFTTFFTHSLRSSDSFNLDIYSEKLKEKLRKRQRRVKVSVASWSSQLPFRQAIWLDGAQPAGDLYTLHDIVSVSECDGVE